MYETRLGNLMAHGSTNKYLHINHLCVYKDARPMGYLAHAGKSKHIVVTCELPQFIITANNITKLISFHLPDVQFY